MTVALTQTLPDGRRSTQAVAGLFEITRLSFPAGFAHEVIDPSRGYMVIRLAGGVCKTFRQGETTLARGGFAYIPAGAAHSSVFALCPNEVLTVRAASEGGEEPFGSLLHDLRHVNASAAATLGWRMAGELAAHDSGAALALEGLALQLLATADRAGAVPRGGDGPTTGWLATVRELLHDRVPATMSLQELGEAVGRHPSHVAREFRREYGATVAQYVRTLRLEWAAAALAASDVSVARIAIEAGFADQSHFTRAFRESTGVTPGRYRRRVQASP